MSRLHGRLTALAVKNATARGIINDGNGLCLQVARSGSRSWILRYRFGGRRRHLGLGGFPAVSLAEARERAMAARAMLRESKDPVTIKAGQRAVAALAAATAMSFAEAAHAYIASHTAGWGRESTAQWKQSLALHVLPVIGALPVRAVDTPAVMRVLTPIWTTKTVTADRVRSRIEMILDWAKVAGQRDGENPARWGGHIEQLLPAKSKIAKVEPHVALPYAELPAFMAAVRQDQNPAARTLELAILTAARSGEVRFADWSEIDLAACTWTVPAARMKAKREHHVPLSDAAVALLEALPGARTGLVFPTRRNRPHAKSQLWLAVKRIGRPDVTVHGFRSTFSTWAAERSVFSSEVVEHALAHATGSQVERAYRRTTQLEHRVQLMAQWADFCAGKAPASAAVIELRRA